MFKVGDKVKRTGISCDGVEFGGEYIVTNVQPFTLNEKWLLLEGCGDTMYNPEFFLKLGNSPVVEYNKQTAPNAPVPHKHSALIKAWADGALIQVKTGYSGWVGILKPKWEEGREFRIKPEPRPDVEAYIAAVVPTAKMSPLYAHEQGFTSFCTFTKTVGDNIKCTFDGETGKLKGVELC